MQPHDRIKRRCVACESLDGVLRLCHDTRSAQPQPRLLEQPHMQRRPRQPNATERHRLAVPPHHLPRGARRCLAARSRCSAHGVAVGAGVAHRRHGTGHVVNTAVGGGGGHRQPLHRRRRRGTLLCAAGWQLRHERQRCIRC